MYNDLKTKNPSNGSKVLVGTCEAPINPKIAIYRNGKFWDVSDITIELFPTHWKYPNVPFIF